MDIKHNETNQSSLTDTNGHNAKYGFHYTLILVNYFQCFFADFLCQTFRFHSFLFWLIIKQLIMCVIEKGASVD